MEKIIATYSYSFNKLHPNGWGHKRLLKWIDAVGVGHNIMYSNYIQSLNVLSLRKGERFIISCKEIMGDMMRFPIEFEGVNNDKHFIFDTRWQKFYSLDKIPVDGPEKLDRRINIGDEYYSFTGTLYDRKISDTNRKYFAFKPSDVPCSFVFLNYKNKGFDIMPYDWNDEFRITFERPLYEIKDITNGSNHGIKIFVGEFPILIENLNNSKVVEYDVVSQIYHTKL